jgi:hypothetical protein
LEIREVSPQVDVLPFRIGTHGRVTQD